MQYSPNASGSVINEMREGRKEERRVWSLSCLIVLVNEALSCLYHWHIADVLRVAYGQDVLSYWAKNP